MKHLKIGALGGAAGCFMVGCGALIAVFIDRRKFDSLPALPATKDVVETLRQVHYTDLRFMVFLAVCVLVLGVGLLIGSFFESKKP